MRTDEYFDTGEFKEMLRRYEQSRAAGESIYLEADNLTDIAEYYHAKGRLDEALGAIDYALELFPGATLPLVFRARIALIKEQDAEKARRLIDRVDETDDPDYIYMAAEIMVFQKREKEADRFLTEQYAMLDDEEEQVDFCLDVATLFADYELFALADKWLKRSGADKADSDYKDLSARIALSKGNTEYSKRIYNELLDENPYSTHYWNQLATSQFLENDYAHAIESSEFSIAIDPTDPDALLNKANALFALGNWEEALEYFDRYARLEPDDELGYMLKGITLLTQGREKEALEQLRMAESRAKADSPNLTEIYKQLAFVLSHFGKQKEALGYIGRMEELMGMETSELLVLKGHVLLENKQLRKALVCFAKAMQMAENDLSVFLHVAMSVYDNGYPDTAKGMFEKILEADGNEAGDIACAYLARCAEAKNDMETFLHYLKASVERSPQTTRQVLGDLFPESLNPEDYYHYFIENKQ